MFCRNAENRFGSFTFVEVSAGSFSVASHADIDWHRYENLRVSRSPLPVCKSAVCSQRNFGSSSISAAVNNFVGQRGDSSYIAWRLLLLVFCGFHGGFESLSPSSGREWTLSVIAWPRFGIFCSDITENNWKTRQRTAPKRVSKAKSSKVARDAISDSLFWCKRLNLDQTRGLTNIWHVSVNCSQTSIDWTWRRKDSCRGMARNYFRTK